MNILKNYTPYFLQIGHKIVDLKQLGTLVVKKEIDYKNVITQKEGIFSFQKSECQAIETGRYYVWLKAVDNHYNEQIYFNTKKEADKVYKKIQTLLKVHHIK